MKIWNDELRSKIVKVYIPYSTDGYHSFGAPIGVFLTRELAELEVKRNCMTTIHEANALLYPDGKVHLLADTKLYDTNKNLAELEQKTLDKVKTSLSPTELEILKKHGLKI